jgi:hypothetical protein
LDEAEKVTAGSVLKFSLFEMFEVLAVFSSSTTLFGPPPKANGQELSAVERYFAFCIAKPIIVRM